MPRRQKKYLSREMIVKDIDAAERKYRRLLTQAQLHIDNAAVARAFAIQSKVEVCQEKADELLGKASRLKNTRMKRLQATLAAFDTKPMFGEEQVVLQKV